MDENLSALVQTAKKLALLAETLERRSGEAVATQQRAVATLAQAVVDIRSDASRILDASTSVEDSVGRARASLKYLFRLAMIWGRKPGPGVLGCRTITGRVRTALRADRLVSVYEMPGGPPVRRARFAPLVTLRGSISVTVGNLLPRQDLPAIDLFR